jgi:D-alanyl-D-alanine carboxypeptidase
MSPRKLLCLFIVVAFVGLAAQAGHAEMKTRQTVPQIIQSFFKTNNLPGLVVSIQKKNQHFVYVHGKANLELNEPMKATSVFRIASVTKLFTTFGILVLKERGLLTVNDKLSLYLPDFPYADRITIKNLLQHTSGIPNWSDIEAFGANQAKDWTPDELIALLTDYIKKKGALDFPAGTQAAYSNSNFTILGMIIEKVSGKAYGDFVAENVVAPLKMKDTRLGSDKEIIPLRTSGYNIENGKATNAPFVSVVAPFATGDFLSRPTEIVKFAKAFTPGALFKRETIDEMMQQAVLSDGAPYVETGDIFDSSYGYCWELIKVKGKTEWIYSKSGSISGFFAYFFYFKSADVAIAISSNAQGSFSLGQLGLDLGVALNAVK